jgi:hypothetical protein
MTTYKKKWFFVLCIVLVSLIAISIFAGPTIIRDNRIFDLAATPVLGRGYSLSTNTFQSTCMKDIKVTRPSYDFDYTFESMESLKETKRASTISGKADVSYLAFDIKASGTSTTIEGKMYFYHNVRVEVNVDTYYASVDESSTNLSDSSRILLANNDIPGFFHSCGSYYVRSLGRTAKFVSIFTYLHEEETRDKQFELQLELAIKGFGAQLIKLLGGGGQADLSLSVKSSFAAMARKKRLTITTKAWGLGKNEKASLISYDLETYKAAIKDAFMSMQDPMTGRVTTMEIVPWVENADFQRYIKLEEDTEAETGKKLLLFEKKHILSMNAEFLARIDRTARNLMDIYYKALICRQMIDMNWKRDGKFLPGLEDAEIQNNRNPNKIRITRLDSELSPENIEQLYRNEDAFMYGEGGARDCIKEIIKEGIFKRSWRDIEVCRNLRKKFSTSLNEIIDDYCMPRLVRQRIEE